MTTYTWHVADLERHTADGAVYTVHWTCTATNANKTAGSYGSIGLDAPEPDNMIPFEQLTEEIVIGWVKEKLGAEGVANIEASLDNQLAELIAPTTASGLPWADNATANEGADA